MKKIPTLFERTFENHKVVGISPNVTPGCERAFEEGEATIKFDGSCCAMINGKFYKRYDAKGGKKVPEGGIPCCDPDPVTGHWPHWVPVDGNNTSDKWLIGAYENELKAGSAWARGGVLKNGTYEAVGPHFQGNPHCFEEDALLPHGMIFVGVDRSFEAIRKWLEEHEEEGLVFWLDGEPRCKIKRTDFGLDWPIKR
ncbi:MAG: hypothetical protein IJ418_21985 [Clostridia bacterium]|nr:hypothetical protein [Clostridia bacterium]